MNRHLITLLRSPFLHLYHLKQVHALIVTGNFDLHAFFFKRLLHLCFLGYARHVFNAMPKWSSDLWYSLISAYSRICMHGEAIEALFLMHRLGNGIGHTHFPLVLRSCAALQAVREGRQLHALIFSCGFTSNTFVQTALIDLYAKGGLLEAARLVFDEIMVPDPVSYNCLISGYSKVGLVADARELFEKMNERTIVSWNSIISCYVHNGDLMEAFRMFERMQMEGFPPNEITLVTVLSMCAKSGDLQMGLKIEKLIAEKKICKSMFVSTALLEMYVKCGAVDDALVEFGRMKERDVVSWSAMIAGCAQNGRPGDALQLFEQMKVKNVRPNDVTLVSVLSACAQLGSIDTAERIGCYVENSVLASNIYVSSALVDMYSKCGNIEKARQIFHQMAEQDIVTWNAMIGGLAVNGLAAEAISLFVKMEESYVNPNEITFVSLLTACSHAGLVELGFKFFNLMKVNHKISPKIEHCACIVDLLCKSGKLKEAYEFICTMEVEPNVVVWGTFLSASRLHSNVDYAEYAIEKLIQLEPENSGNYVLLSNLYASTGRWEEAVRVRNIMRVNRVQKEAAYSWIEVDNSVHRFLVGDTSHPEIDEIHETVIGLDLLLKWVYYNSNDNSELCCLPREAAISLI